MPKHGGFTLEWEHIQKIMLSQINNQLFQEAQLIGIGEGYLKTLLGPQSKGMH